MTQKKNQKANISTIPPEFAVNPWRRFLTNRLILLVVVGIIIFVNVIFSFSFMSRYIRFDMTDDKVNTMTDYSKRIVSELKDPVTIKAVMSEELPAELSVIKKRIKDLLAEYKAHSGGKFQYEYVTADTYQNLEQMATELGVQPLQLTVQAEGERESRNIFMGLAMLYRDQKEVIPFVHQGNIDTMEYEITKTIVNLTKTDENTKIIGVLSGHGEPTVEEMPPMMQQMQTSTISFLKKQIGSNVRTVELNASGMVDDDISILLIINPQTPLSEWDLYALDQYILRGGKVIVFFNKVNADIQSGQATQHNLEWSGFWKNYGVEAFDNIVEDSQCHLIPIQFPGTNRRQEIQYPPFPIITSFSDHIIVKQLSNIHLHYPASLNDKAPDGAAYSIETLFSSSDKCRIQAGNYQIQAQNYLTLQETQFTDSAKALGILVQGKFKSYFADREIPESPNEGMLPQTERLMESAHETQIIVVADGDFIVDETLQLLYDIYNRSITMRLLNPHLNILNNAAFVVNAIDWMSQDDGLIQIRGKTIDPPRLDPALKKGEMEGTKTAWKWMNILLMPFLFSLLALTFWLLRKRKQYIVGV